MSESSNGSTDLPDKRNAGSFLQVNPGPRLLLFYVAIFMKIVASALSAIGFVLGSAVIMIIGAVVWLFFLIVLLVIAAPVADRFLQGGVRWLRSAAIAIAAVILATSLGIITVLFAAGPVPDRDERAPGTVTHLLASLKDVFGYNDAAALSHQAAENFLDGKNPYAESNIVTATIRFNNSTAELTPLRVGRFSGVFPYPDKAQLDDLWREALRNPKCIPPEIESKFNYPAGGFLLPAFFIRLGIGDLRLIYLILTLPVLAYVVVRVRRDLRLLLAGALLISVELWYAMAAGETGFLYFPFLLLAWFLSRRNWWLSALFMAVAVAVKQMAWFLLPFYLVLQFRTLGLKRVLASVSIVAGVFFASNAPFIVSDPSLWVSSVAAPMTDHLFPLGIGAVSPVIGGVLEVRSPLVFGVLEGIVALAALLWYFRYCPRYPNTGPVLSVLPLFFAWRSLWGYFFYMDIIVLTAIMINEYGERPVAPAVVTA